MQYITSEEISKLAISPKECVDWVREAFLMKNKCQLPPKISLHPRGNDFFNTMPCLLPEEYNTFGCKVVSRVKGTSPALKSDMMIFDTNSGAMMSLMNCDWITAMRTGAVATLAINTLRKSDAHIYAFIGLGVMAYATLECLFATNIGKDMVIKLKRYKDQAERVISRFPDIKNVTFEIVEDTNDLVRDADVIVSAITDADGLLVEDTALFKPGVLIVPIHTRGFQNCDKIFDRVIADDEGHVKGFKYFKYFKNFTELTNVLNGSDPGRMNDLQRILSYNIGLGLHDILFGYKILQRLKNE